MATDLHELIYNRNDPVNEFDSTRFNSEANYSIDFSEHKKLFVTG